jgi:hypothetical protein
MIIYLTKEQVKELSDLKPIKVKITTAWCGTLSTELE